MAYIDPKSQVLLPIYTPSDCRRVSKGFKIKISIYWILSLLYMGLIFFVSSYPLSTKILSFSFFDKLAHISEYGILVSLIYFALRDSNTTKHHSFKLALVIAFMYGISDEIHQYFVPGRQANIFDVVADGIGVLCFSLVLHLRMHRQKSHSAIRGKYKTASPSQEKKSTA